MRVSFFISCAQCLIALIQYAYQFAVRIDTMRTMFEQAKFPPTASRPRGQCPQDPSARFIHRLHTFTSSPSPSPTSTPTSHKLHSNPQTHINLNHGLHIKPPQLLHQLPRPRQHSLRSLPIIAKGAQEQAQEQAQDRQKVPSRHLHSASRREEVFSRAQLCAADCGCARLDLSWSVLCAAGTAREVPSSEKDE